jgi:multidrug efflux pump
MVTGFVSTTGELSRLDLGDFVHSRIKDPIGRVDGVGSVQVFGPEYAMRIWLKPDALIKYGLTVSDVESAIQNQNIQLTGGDLGGMPAVKGQQLNATINTQSLLETPEQFRSILIETRPDGAQVKLKDIARVELGAGTSHIDSYYNGHPSAGMAINLAPGANALETTNRVKKRLNQLKPYFPEDVELRYPFESAPFVQASMEAVMMAIGEAIFLVILVMLLFLQSWRATLIPALAIPVVLMGACGIMAVAGASINMLTMFGLVLAIGLLVDDAIVVVENVERVMHEKRLSPLEATRQSMRQISGALVGIGVVLSAVFIPMAFFPGTTGAIYRQFSISLVGAMILSVLVALILSPTVCAGVLKPQQDQTILQRIFGWFNTGLNYLVRGYLTTIDHMGRRIWTYIWTFIFFVIVAVTVVLFTRLPTGFLPKADQGVAIAQVKLPTGATQQRTNQTLDQIEQYFLNQKAVEGLFTVAGFSFLGQSQNVGLAFINLKPWHKRNSETQNVSAVINRANRNLARRITDGRAFAFNLPAMMQLGNATGFELHLQDRGGLGHQALMQAQNQFLKLAAKSPVLKGVRPNGLADKPQYNVSINHEKAQTLQVPLSRVNDLISVAWGSHYVNDFMHNDRVKRVFMQGDAPYRMLPNDFNDWYVRNAEGTMTPLGDLVNASWDYGSPKLERYNGVASREILGEPAKGYSEGEAMAEVDKLVKKLPDGIAHAWSGLSYQQRQGGSYEWLLYALSILVVFLALAALYESWTIPVSVILAVPLGIIGAVLAAMLRGLPNDVFFQVGVLTTIGVTARNAILVIEFARKLENEGLHLIEATREAARVRLRPILMTSMAFTMGVLPLAFAEGAGASLRIAIGTAVLGGMISAAVLATLFIPLFYIVVRRTTDGFKQLLNSNQSNQREGN